MALKANTWQIDITGQQEVVDALKQVSDELGYRKMLQVHRAAAGEIRKEVRKRIPRSAHTTRTGPVKHVRQTCVSGAVRGFGFVFVGARPVTRQFFYGPIIHQTMNHFMAKGVEAGWDKMLARFVSKASDVMAKANKRVGTSRRKPKPEVERGSAQWGRDFDIEVAAYRGRGIRKLGPER